MKTIIVYGSQYGTTKRYAQELSRRTGLPCLPYGEAKEIRDYDKVVYLGALYAGGVLGLAKTAKQMAPGQRLILATVGLADPDAPENRESITRSVSRQLPGELFQNTALFFLRGGIDYQTLTLPHRAMMGLLIQKVRRLPPEERNAEAEALLATYNQAVDFVDFDRLEPILQAL